MLFDGTNLDQWVSAKDKSPAKWTVADGVITVNKPAGNIETKRSFTNYQLHLEWRDSRRTSPARVRRAATAACSSPRPAPGDAGYELQILDSYNNKTYVNGQAGSIYKQSSRSSTPCGKPGEWQTYDVIWTAPTFNADGIGQDAGVRHGVPQRRAGAEPRRAEGRDAVHRQPEYKAHGAAPIKLQAHGDPSPPISFRNIWVREL